MTMTMMENVTDMWELHEFSGESILKYHLTQSPVTVETIMIMVAELRFILGLESATNHTDAKTATVIPGRLPPNIFLQPTGAETNLIVFTSSFAHLVSKN